MGNCRDINPLSHRERVGERGSNKKIPGFISPHPVLLPEGKGTPCFKVITFNLHISIHDITDNSSNAFGTAVLLYSMITV
jgi:hypothetical protein